MATINPEGVEVEILLIEEPEPESVPGIEEVELDSMGRFVGKKKNQRWLWHAIDRLTGKVLAYVFGRRKDEVFLKLKKLLEHAWNQALLYRWTGSISKTFARR